MPDDNVPTPMPGAKPSGGGAGKDPRATTDKATTAEESEANKKPELTDEEKAHMQTHASALQKLFGQPQRAAVGADSGGPNKTVTDAVDEAVASAPGHTADY